VLRRYTGLRTEVRYAGRTPHTVPWDVVPSAVLQSLYRPERPTQPPESLRVRRFGNAYSTSLLALTSTRVAPSRHALAP